MSDPLDSVRSLVEPWGWEPRLTAQDGAWRAWMRKPAPHGWQRIFGRPAGSVATRPLRVGAESGPCEHPEHAEVERWRRIETAAKALDFALSFHNQTPAGRTRRCLPSCLACDARREYAVARREAPHA